MSDWQDSFNYNPYTDFNLGNFGNDNAFNADPFPMEQFRTSQLPDLMNQGQQQNNIADVMGQIGAGVNNDPALSRYFQMAQQGPPTREQYAPSTGRKILAAIGGIGSMFSDPSHAIQNTSAILDRPYDLAAGQYKQDLATAADAAKQENSLLNTGTSIYGHIAQAENYKNMASSRAGTLGLGYDRLSQNTNIAQQRINIQQRLAGVEAQYKAGALSIAQRNSEISAGRLQLQQLESGSLINERNTQADLNNARTSDLQFGPLSGNRSTGPRINRPDAAYSQFTMRNELVNDPLLNKYYDLTIKDFRPDLQEDPDAWARYLEIRGKYTGGPPRNPWDPNPLGFNTGGLP